MVGSEQSSERGRLFDILSAIIVSIATVLSAWCGYEAARWSGHQTALYGEANAARIKAAELRDRGNATTAIDVAIFTQYVIAQIEDRGAVAGFLRSHMRLEMRPAFDAWLAQDPLHNPKASSSPFVLPEYRLAVNEEAHGYDDRAAATFQRALDANARSDEYVLATVLFASVMFLGGVGVKLRRPADAVMHAVAVLLLIVGIVFLVRYPIL